MALSSLIRRFTIELADIDRGVYETLDFRLPQHPSETEVRVVTCVLARCLLEEPGLDFGAGLAFPDEPALWVRGANGVGLWVDVGAPSVDRLHRANKRADRVVVVSGKPPELLRQSWVGGKIHKADTIEVWLLAESLVTPLAESLERRMDWVVTIHDGQLSVISGDLTVSADIAPMALPEI